MFRFIIPDSKTTVLDLTDSLNYYAAMSAPVLKEKATTVRQPGSSQNKGGKAVPAKYNGNPVRQRLPKLDLNKCDSALLVSLPGIGPVLSVRIIKYRRLLGGFASVNQLKEVYGLPEETYDLIKDRVFADTADISRIDINLAGYKELSRFPYFEKYEVNAIIKFRELNGKISKVSDLTDNKLVPVEKTEKIKPYLKFE
jgi:competence protein ComEA